MQGPAGGVLTEKAGNVIGVDLQGGVGRGIVADVAHISGCYRRCAGGDDQCTGGVLVGPGTGAAINSEVQLHTAGEGPIRHKAQIVQAVVRIFVAVITKCGSGQAGTGKGCLIPLAVPGIEGAGSVECTVRPAEFHILEAAGAVAAIVDLFKVILVKGNFVTGLHRVGDIALGRGGTGLIGGDDQCTGGRLIAFAVFSAVKGEAQRNTAREGPIRHKAQIVQAVIRIFVAVITKCGSGQAGTGKGCLIPLAVPGIEGAGSVECTVRPAEFHILEAAGAVAAIVDLFKVILVKGNFVTGLHRVGDIALGRGGTGLIGGDDQCTGGRLIAFAVFSAVKGEAQRNAAGEGLVRHKAQLVQIVVTIVAVTVVELVAAEAGTGEGSLIPLAIPGVEGTGIVERAVGPAEFHILEAAGAAAVLIDLLKIVIVKGNFLTGFHCVSNVTLAGGCRFRRCDFQGSADRIILLAASPAVSCKCNLNTIGKRLIRHKAQFVQIIVTIVAVTVVELVIVQFRAGKRGCIPLAVPGINGTGIAVIRGRLFKYHILQRAGAASIVIGINKIFIVKGNFLASFHRVGDVTLGGTGTAADFNIHRAGHIILAPLTMYLKLHTQCTAVSPAVGFKCQAIQRVVHILGHIAAVIIKPCVTQIAFTEAHSLIIVIHSGQVPIVIQIAVIGEYHIAGITTIFTSVKVAELPLFE